jgi:hypothetical protein
MPHRGRFEAQSMACPTEMAQIVCECPDAPESVGPPEHINQGRRKCRRLSALFAMHDLDIREPMAHAYSTQAKVPHASHTLHQGCKQLKPDLKLSLERGQLDITAAILAK